MLCLGLNRLVRLRGPRTSTITRWRIVIDVKAIETTLDTGVVHVEIPSLVYRSLGEMWLIGSAHVGFCIDHHWRRLSPGWSRRTRWEGIERLNSR